MRLDYLIQQAKDALKFAVKNGPVTFPCACIAGDVVILHLLHELGYLKTGEVKVVLIDTLHLFPETLDFFREKELLRHDCLFERKVLLSRAIFY